MKMLERCFVSLFLVLVTVMIVPLPSTSAAVYWVTTGQVKCDAVAFGYRAAARIILTRNGVTIGSGNVYCFQSDSASLPIRTFLKPNDWHMTVDIINPKEISNVVCTASGSGTGSSSFPGSITVTCDYGSATGSVQKPWRGI